MYAGPASLLPLSPPSGILCRIVARRGGGNRDETSDDQHLGPGGDRGPALPAHRHGAHAHGAPADLSVWGGFNPLVARCQRTISRAASLCAGRTLAARTRCSAAQLQRRDLRQRRARRRGHRRARSGHSIGSRAPAPSTSCRTSATSTSGRAERRHRRLPPARHGGQSAAFGPAMFGGTVAAIDAATTPPASPATARAGTPCCATRCAPISARSTASPPPT